MWYNPELNIKASTHSEIRSACPQVSMPVDMTEENIAEVGFFPYVETLAEIQARLDEEHLALIPQYVSMRQARLALLAAGVLPTVDAVVAQAGEAAKIEWEYATEVKRDWPLVVQLTTVLGLDLDALMIAAGKL